MAGKMHDMIAVDKEEKEGMVDFAIAGVGAYSGLIVNKYMPQFAKQYTTIVLGVIELVIAFLLKKSDELLIFFGSMGVVTLLDGIFRLFVPQFAI